MDLLIMLTATVNVNFKKEFLFQTNKTERLNIYIRSVLKWLKHTNFNIMLIDNSGYEFNELNIEKEKYKDRFKVFTFDESLLLEADYLENNASKGASELFALNYAYNTIVKKPVFIIKITCRYFIPELEDFLSKYNLSEYDCLTQYNRDRCEMVGTHSKHFFNVFNTSLLNEHNKYDNHIENTWKLRTSKYNKVLVCKKFLIETTQRGGLNQKFIDI